jgi:hypothetical protein
MHEGFQETFAESLRTIRTLLGDIVQLGVNLSKLDFHNAPQKQAHLDRLLVQVTRDENILRTLQAELKALSEDEKKTPEIVLERYVQDAINDIVVR